MAMTKTMTIANMTSITKLRQDILKSLYLISNRTTQNKRTALENWTALDVLL